MRVVDDGDAGLVVRAEGAVRIVVLDRPAVRNAVDEALHTALSTVFDELADDPDAAVVVLTGTGGAFSAGGDLDYIARFADDAPLRRRTMDEARTLLWSMIRFPLPVIAAVDGPAVGLGMSLALASDIVLVSERAVFADPHVGVGLVCGDGGAALLPLVAPLLRAKELLFTGARIDAVTAVELGVANRVVTGRDVLDEALDLARRISTQPAFALRETKRAIQLGIERAVGDVVEAAAAAEELSMATDDHRARIAALRPRTPQETP